MELFSVIAASLAVMAVSFSGKFATWRGVGPVVERNLHYFVSFASGVLLIIAFNLSTEIVAHAGSMTAGIPWIALGAAVVLVAFRYLPNFHHHHDIGDHSHSRIDANRILASDAIHNIGDGVVIVISFAASPLIGIASTVSIMVHEMLQEISEFFVLREAGLSARRALTLNFMASATILIGTFGGYFLLERFEALEIPLLGLAVGSYLVVIFHDLIPHSLERAGNRSHALRHVIFFAVGLLLMSAIAYALPHGDIG